MRHAALWNENSLMIPVARTTGSFFNNFLIAVFRYYKVFAVQCLEYKNKKKSQIEGRNAWGLRRKQKFIAKRQGFDLIISLEREVKAHQIALQ